MLDRPEEYLKMNEVEEHLWWYKILHFLVYSNIKNLDKNIKILDAGCGTGGLLAYLYKKGFTNLTGFDLSQHAIDFANKRLKDTGISLFQHNLIDPISQKDVFDLIISNDTFYYFSFEEQKQTLNHFHQKLNKNGLIILNLPALQAFSGIHDEAVGIRKRFTKEDLDLLIDEKLFKLKQITYWPLFLSPLIYLSRWIQRQKKKTGTYNVTSDVNLPPILINHILFFLTQFEVFFKLPIPFGSSMFVVLQVKK